MFLHITNDPIKTLDLTGYGKVAIRVQVFGKPLGLWYAPDLVWVKRMDSLKSWDITASASFPGTIPHILDYYTNVLKNKEIPAGTTGDAMCHPLCPRVHYAYNLPLKDSFETDITKPDVTKIFKLSSENMDAFEAAFKPFHLAKIRDGIKSPRSPYELYLNARSCNYFKKDEDTVKEFLASKGITPTTHLDKYLHYMIRVYFVKTLAESGMDPEELKRIGTFANTPASFGLTIKEFKAAVKGGQYPDGITKNIELFDRIRMYDYGHFYEEVMRKQWGGIHYDQSIFTPELEAKYPYIPYVEVASGCLWQPQIVLAGYDPKPIAVLGLADSPESAAQTEQSVPEEYRAQLFIAGIKDGELFSLKKGTVIGGKHRKTRRRVKY